MTAGMYRSNDKNMSKTNRSSLRQILAARDVLSDVADDDDSVQSELDDTGPTLTPEQEFQLSDSEQGRRAQVDLSKLPALRGSEKQIKWATTIRQTALALNWLADQRVQLEAVNDASWWIANRYDLRLFKFQPPAPGQMATSAAPAPAPVYVQPESVQPASSSRTYVLKSVASQSLNDPEKWAQSVCHTNPQLAEAALVALLANQYSGEMRERLRKRAAELIVEAEMSFHRDVDAINKILTLKPS